MLLDQNQFVRFILALLLLMRRPPALISINDVGDRIFSLFHLAERMEDIATPSNLADLQLKLLSVRTPYETAFAEVYDTLYGWCVEQLSILFFESFKEWFEERVPCAIDGFSQYMPYDTNRKWYKPYIDMLSVYHGKEISIRIVFDYIESDRPEYSVHIIDRQTEALITNTIAPRGAYQSSFTDMFAEQIEAQLLILIPD